MFEGLLNKLNEMLNNCNCPPEVQITIRLPEHLEQEHIELTKLAVELSEMKKQFTEKEELYYARTTIFRSDVKSLEPLKDFPKISISDDHKTAVGSDCKSCSQLKSKLENL